MVSQANLIQRGGSSSAANRRLDLEVEDEIIRIPACDLNTVAERFKRTLIGRVLHQGGRSVEALIALLPRARIWNVEGRVRGVNLGNGRFQFDFDKEEDLVMVLNKRPCHFNHWIFALERWEPVTSDNFPNTIPFWIKVTGVPVHYWNDETFEEIAKALGKRVTIDATNARLQVSIDADRPLQFERRVGFPNGDVGKVSLEYEGLIRYCFACKRIDHDVYSCTECSQEERDQKIKELREQNELGLQAQQNRNLGLIHNRNNNLNNKRPRSPSDDGLNKSPGRPHYPGYARGEKRRKESPNYRSSRYHEDHRGFTKISDRRREDKHERIPSGNTTVWNRLESHSKRRSVEAFASQYKNQDRVREYERNRGRAKYLSHHSRYSQQVWRPKSQVNESKSNNQNKSVGASETPAPPSRALTDSQRTISEVRQGRGGRDTQGTGVMVVHRNEMSEERVRRIKGKAPMFTEALEKTPMSAAKFSPAGLLTRDRGVLRIRDGESPLCPEETRYVSSLVRPSTEPEIVNLDLDRLMESHHIDNLVMTREDEAEVDKLVEDFGDVIMDDNMMQNDDLLVDEPGFDAEKIDAISQLSPAYAEDIDKQREDYQEAQMSDANPRAMEKGALLPSAGRDKKIADAHVPDTKGISKQSNLAGTESKKRNPQSPGGGEGVRASKKLSLPRGRPSPKKPKAQGTSKKSQKNDVPRIEVFPSTKRMNSSSVSGSVVSQKPPSKKI